MNNIDNEEVYDIHQITFGVYSAEEIRKFSVCKIDNPKLCNSDKNGSYGTVYDPRMGTIENGKICVTCGQNVWHCAGHFASIELHEAIIHPLYYKEVVNFLRCFCTKCYKLLITEEQININSFNRSKGVKRFNKILERLEKIDMCIHCNHPQPAIKHTTNDNSISMIYKDKEKKKVSIILQVDEIRKVFENISDHDVELIGFDPSLMHPKNLIITVFPVIPTCFVKDTYVLTNNGYKYIQNVEKDDKLYTHTGTFQKINDFQTKNYTGKLIHIKNAYHANTISCTPEHPFYVKQVDGYISPPMWVNAGDLEDNHYIGMKRNTNSIVPKIEDTSLDNPDIWFIIGYFVSNGYIHDKERLFSLCIDDDVLHDILTRLKIAFTRKEKFFECNDWYLWNILKCFETYIPHWVVDAPKKFVQRFIEGFSSKISYYRPNNSRILQLLYMKLDSYEETIDKSLCIVEDDYIWFKITNKNTTFVENEQVYNFEVDKDNSYCVENLISHNCCRPYVISDSNMCDDDLTIQLVEIIKANNHLEQVDGIPIPESKKQKYLQSLKFRISTFYNNSGNKAKHSTNGRAIKGIKERLTSKDGIIRTNLMGKRCEMTARTVIGPDPTLKMGQLCIPPQIADNLTYPVPVTNFNINYLTDLVNRGRVNFILKDNGQTRINLENALFFKGTRLNHGDIVVRENTETGEDEEILVTNGKMLLQKGDKVKRNGEFLEDVKYPERRTYTLNIGDICERKLQDGDILLLNRQPTLHEGSMLGQEVVIRPGKTIRFNLSINKSFNAGK